MKVIKKDGTLEEFDGEKIVNAVNKSASRVMITLDDTAFREIVGAVLAVIKEKGLTDIPVATMHNIVEQVLDKYDPRIARVFHHFAITFSSRPPTKKSYTENRKYPTSPTGKKGAELWKVM